MSRQRFFFLDRFITLYIISVKLNNWPVFRGWRKAVFTGIKLVIYAGEKMKYFVLEIVWIQHANVRWEYTMVTVKCHLIGENCTQFVLFVWSMMCTKLVAVQSGFQEFVGVTVFNGVSLLFVWMCTNILRYRI